MDHKQLVGTSRFLSLYHGTFPGVLHLIRAGGLKKMARHHVHLAADRATAQRVGQRRGKPFVFHVSENGVWLTDHVPPTFIEFPEGA